MAFYVLMLRGTLQTAGIPGSEHSPEIRCIQTGIQPLLQHLQGHTIYSIAVGGHVWRCHFWHSTATSSRPAAHVRLVKNTSNTLTHQFVQRDSDCLRYKVNQHVIAFHVHSLLYRLTGSDSGGKCKNLHLHLPLYRCVSFGSYKCLRISSLPLCKDIQPVTLRHPWYHNRKRKKCRYTTKLKQQ